MPVVDVPQAVRRAECLRTWLFYHIGHGCDHKRKLKPRQQSCMHSGTSRPMDCTRGEKAPQSLSIFPQLRPLWFSSSLSHSFVIEFLSPVTKYNGHKDLKAKSSPSGSLLVKIRPPAKHFPQSGAKSMRLIQGPS